MRRARSSTPRIPPEFRRIGFLTLAVVLVVGLVASTAEAQFNSGDVLAGVGAGKIKRFNPAGTLQQTLNSGTTSTDTTGMCFDSSGNLFGTLFTIDQVAKYNNTGALLGPFGTGYSSPESCVVAGGNIFFGQADSTQIKKLDASGFLITNFTVAVGPLGTDWIDLAADQCTMHYTSEGSAIKQFNVCTNTQLADFATGLPGGDCFAHRIRPNGEEMVACTTQIHRISPAGTILQSYAVSGFTPAEGFVFALNLDPDGTTFWTGGYHSGNVYRINIASGAQVTSWNAGILGISLAGLAVVGEIVVSQPTPTPTGTVLATATPTTTPTATPTPPATATPTSPPATATPTSPPVQAVVPTLSFPMLGLLALALAAAALLLMRR
jgi:hypothetical protein